MRISGPVIDAARLKRLEILRAVARFFAGDDVVWVAGVEAFDLHATARGVCEALDAIWCEDEVQVERPVLELHEILAALALRCCLPARSKPA